MLSTYGAHNNPIAVIIPKEIVIFQKLGIEWFWRLMLQPSRIFRMIVLPIYLMKIVFTKDITKGKSE